MKYQPERDLELAAVETKSVSPTTLALWVLNKRNQKIDPTAVTKYFSRHPDLKKTIDNALLGLAPTATQAVDNSLFENGNFRETSSVKEWFLFMKSRRRKGKPLKEEYIQTSQIGVLKRICSDFNKHPDRLTYHDAQEIFLAYEAKGMDTYCFRRVLKDFLKSKGSPDWEKIGVGKPRGFGDYKDLFVEKATLDLMLAWIKEQNFETYVQDMLMFHNGLRINAVETAKIEDFKIVGSWQTITVLEKFREVRTFKIVPLVADLIKQVIGERKEGLIFTLNDGIMEGFNNKAIDRFCPEIRVKYKHIHPNHFWRHMCIQQLLRVTNRNSKAVAAIVQCSEQSLNESYGAATNADVEKWETEFLPLL